MTRIRLAPARHRTRNHRRGFDQLFDSMLSERESESPEFTSHWRPNLDVVEDKQEFVLSAELPGVAQDSINISFKDNVLELRGEKPLNEENTPHYNERRFGTFHRAVRFDADIAQDKIRADYSNGVLTVTLPKTKDSRQREIAINFK
ncbi:MAG: Hsp20/alpha crystallin family protein [Candidatus Marinimicrobia bacterium]|nr:Hsp20/alpha crystallin family protein [Candidatus Neomarinimicrobiota bacterium]MCF7827739.1 Hsp20/alpha crystallin family protein [Candidatus Neomarinimicrobiota bacterium]MCF7881461.1 Hsp20/alpha crystallin family protein [Candidatus Neomarinimicrobiota bacterium]